MSRQSKMRKKASAQREAKRNEPAKQQHRKLAWGMPGRSNIARAEHLKRKKEATKQLEEQRKKEAKVATKPKKKVTLKPRGEHVHSRVPGA